MLKDRKRKCYEEGSRIYRRELVEHIGGNSICNCRLLQIKKITWLEIVFGL